MRIVYCGGIVGLHPDKSKRHGLWRSGRGRGNVQGISQGGDPMINQAMTPSVSFLSRYLLPVLVTVGVNGTALAAEAAVPWECSNYTDEAQTRCLNAFIERQQEQIGQLEGRLQAQQEAVGQLKGQIDRQNAATAQLQTHLAPPAPAPTPAAAP